jgi:acetyl esterase/lipase
MKSLDLSPDATWRRRFHATDIHWAVAAQQNADRGLVSTNKDGIYQLYAWDVVTGELRQVTHEPAGVLLGMISPDGNHIYYLKDEGGNEIGHYVRVPFAEGSIEEDVSPDLPPYSSFVSTQNRLGTLIGFNANTQDSFKIYMKADGSEPTLLYQSERICFGPSFSCDGKIAVIDATDRSKTLDCSLLAFDTETGQQIGELWQENASFELEIFSPVAGDARLVCISSASGFERPLIWDVLTGEQTPLQLEEIPGSIFPYAWSDEAEQILLCQVYQAQYQLYRYEVRTHTVVRLAHPIGTVGFWMGGFFAPNDEIWVVWEDFANPPRLVALDEKTGELKREVLKASDVPEGRAFRSITLTSEKGEPIQGWLAVPDGEGPFPVILETHGGPTSVRPPRFSPWGQCWLDHGFAYFTLNYHGSTTFGKAFEKSIWGNLGELEVQDMATVYNWLVEQGIARPDAVMPTGESYGGFLTLLSLGRCPELWAGGMAGIAIADWKTMYEDEAESLRGYQRALFGGAPDEVPEATRKSSPITYADQVLAPLLVIQGENDTRTPARQLKVYEEKMKSLGKQIEVHWFHAGHGARAKEQQIEHQELMLRFAYRVLG